MRTRAKTSDQTARPASWSRICWGFVRLGVAGMTLSILVCDNPARLVRLQLARAPRH